MTVMVKRFQLRTTGKCFIEFDRLLSFSRKKEDTTGEENERRKQVKYNRCSEVWGRIFIR